MVLISFNHLFAQSAEWVSPAFGFESDTTTEGIAIDNDNNVISVGYYKGILSFPNGDRFIGFGTTREVAIQKIDASGNILWTKDYNSTGTVEASTVTTDTDNNIYISGKLTSTTSFDGISLTSSFSSSSYNYFVLKLDPDGNTLWAKTIPGISAEKPIIVSDSKNNIYILGEFSSTRTFNGTELNVNNGKLYLIKLNTDGNYVYVKQMGATGSSSKGTLTIDSQDNIVITGQTLVNAVFGDDFYNSGGGYVVKLNSLGDFLWSKQLAGLTGNSIVTDSQNNILLTGTYSGTVQIEDETLSSPDFGSLFVLKLDDLGNKIWVKDIQLNATPFYFRRPVIAINNTDNLYITFGFKGTLNYDGTIYNATTSEGTTEDIIISSLGDTNNNGSINWSKQYQRIGYTRDKILAAKDNSLFLTARIRTSSFDGIPLENPNPARIIVAKISDHTLSNNAVSTENKKSFVSYEVFQDRYTLNFHKRINQFSLTIFDVSGKEIQKINNKESLMNFSFKINGASGIYFLTLVTENGVESFKVLKE